MASAIAGTLFDLDRRLTRKIETEKALQISPTELEWFVASGAIDTFRAFVAEQQRKICAERSAKRQSINAANSGSTTERTERTSKSSGTIPQFDANEALRQAQTITGKLA
ncbi:hypothetical protein NF701_05115 [Sphingomonadaceae bacterium OTU29THOMA1]|nr:hypothetical protein NF701_05115 [Sphingomonadaceae bacterium OTU29THOMA1]